MLEKTKFAYAYWYSTNQNLPKPFRSGLGFRIENLFIDLLELLFLATYAHGTEKMGLVTEAIRKLDLLKFLLQTAWEQKHLADKKYISLSQMLAECGRMLFGWKNQLETKNSPDLFSKK